MKKIAIGSTERGILFRDKQFAQILEPGTYRYWNPLKRTMVQVFDIAREPELRAGITQLLVKEFSPAIEKCLCKVTTGPREVAIVYLNARARAIVQPGEERLFWRGLSDISIRRYSIQDQYEIDRETMRDLGEIDDDSAILRVRIPEESVGLLFESELLVRQLSAGQYGFWKPQRELMVSIQDTRITALEVSGQEMLTKDKVSLRANVATMYRIKDAVAAARSAVDVNAELYRNVQLALRQAVGEKTLDELLENKEQLNRGIAADIAAPLERMGVELVRIGIKDIILPGEMRTLLNQVVEAEKAAAAQNIRRREETAATRSLLNTARMMESNPVLMRLKELEAVERISEKIGSLTVYDGLEGVMRGLVALKNQ